MQPSESHSRKPVVDSSFEETVLFADAKRKQEMADRARRADQTARKTFEQTSAEESNPLLEPAEEEEKKKQEMMSLFLTGALFGAVAVGGFVVLKWIFSKKEVAETVAEAMTE